MSTPASETIIERDEPQSPAPNVEPRRELAHRVTGGIEVTLCWNADDNSTSLEVWYPASRQMLRFDVARERALDAFYHPFSQLPILLDFETA